MVAAVAEGKTAAEGAATTLAPTALATLGAGNSSGKQQSTIKRQNGSCGGGNGSSHGRDMGAAVTTATAAAETKAAVAAATAAPTVAEAATQVTAMVVKTLSWSGCTSCSCSTFVRLFVK